MAKQKTTQKTTSKLFAFKGAAVAIAIVLIIICAEVFLTLYGPRYYQFNNRSAEYYTNPRGYHKPMRKEGGRTIYGLDYYSSREGYRLPDDFLWNKSSAREYPIRILGVGDSFTYGRGVKYADIYLTRLERTIHMRYPDIGVRNCGLVGADIEEIVDCYKYETQKNSYPIVLYGFVLNDFGLPGKENIVGLDMIDINNGGNRFNPLRRISKLYNFICTRIEKKHLHNITMRAYHDAFSGDHAARKFSLLDQLCRSIKTKGSVPVIVLFPLLYDLEDYPFQDIHDTMARFCEQEQVLLLDLLPAFSRYRAEELWANPTDHHPNELAHKIAAEEVYAFLLRQNLLGKINENFIKNNQTSITNNQ